MWDWLGGLLPGGQGAPAGTPAPQPSYTGITEPIPPEVQQMNQPTTDPNVIEQRKMGWMQVFQKMVSDPNVMRAVGMFGAAASQPVQPGQSTLGHLSNAAIIGRSAYDFGEQNAYVRSRELSKEKREQEAHEVGLESTKASTEGTRMRTKTAEVQLPGLQAASEIAVATKDDAVKKVKLEVDKINLDIKAATTKEAKDALELEKAKRAKAVLDTISDDVLKQSTIADLKKQGVLNDKQIAETGYYRAHAGEAGARAGLLSEQRRGVAAENKAFESLTPEEKKAAITRKTSGGQTSAQVQMLDAYKANWKLANPGKSDQEAAKAVEKYLTQKKPADETERFLKWNENFGKPGEKQEDALKRFRQLESMLGGEGPAGGPEAATGQTYPVGTTKTWQGKTYKFKGGNWRDKSNWEEVK